MEKTRWLQSIDWTTVGITLVIFLFGCVNVYSVDPNKGIKQLVWFALGMVMLLVVMLLNASAKNFFRTFSPIIYIVSILSLLGVLLVGREINGAKAWYTFGSFSIQPAEFSKMATALFLGFIISQTNTNLKTIKGFMTVAVVMAIPVILIQLQPDLGSILIYFAFIIALYRQGLHWIFVVLPILLIVFFLISLTQQPVLILLSVLYLSLVIQLLILKTGRLDAYKPKWEIVKIIWLAQLFFTITLLLLLIVRDSIIDNSYSAKLLELKNWGDTEYTIGPILCIALIILNFLCLMLCKPSKKNNDTVEFRRSNGGISFDQFRLGLSTISILVLIGALNFSSKFIFDFLPSHHQERILVLFEGEEKYRRTSGFNLLYSKTAIGSGELTGKGFDEGTVKRGSFVPEQSTDYIYCTVGEEWGFIGGSFLILLYTILIIRIYYLSEKNENKFTQFFGYSVASILLMHFIINIGMVTGLFPTVGIPLPFFSYGGSSLWSMMLLVGLFLVFHFQEKESLF